MRRYRMFMQLLGGAFGQMREGHFDNDVDALRAAHQMFQHAAGIDVWDENRRIALIRRDEKRIVRPPEAATPTN